MSTPNPTSLQTYNLLQTYVFKKTHYPSYGTLFDPNYGYRRIYIMYVNLAS